MEKTIFDFSPTKEELLSLENDYSNSDIDKYFGDLKRRSDHFNSSVEYEALCDLQELFKNRKDDVLFKKYSKILDDDYAEMHDRLFNE